MKLLLRKSESYLPIVIGRNSISLDFSCDYEDRICVIYIYYIKLFQIVKDQ